MLMGAHGCSAADAVRTDAERVQTGADGANGCRSVRTGADECGRVQTGADGAGGWIGADPVADRCGTARGASGTTVADLRGSGQVQGADRCRRVQTWHRADRCTGAKATFLNAALIRTKIHQIHRFTEGHGAPMRHFRTAPNAVAHLCRTFRTVRMGAVASPIIAGPSLLMVLDQPHLSFPANRPAASYETMPRVVPFRTVQHQFAGVPHHLALPHRVAGLRTIYHVAPVRTHPHRCAPNSHQCRSTWNIDGSALLV